MNPGLYFSGLRRAALAITVLAGAFIVPATGGNAAADELDSLYSSVIRRPNDSELNLRFAQLAENAGKLRWALSAYERITLNDPNNIEARQGLQRIRRKLQPSTTLLTVQLGAQYESNPNYYIGPRRSELQMLGSAVLLDERAFNGMRWRTNALAAGVVHQHEDQLNYGILGGDTGPVLDAFAGWSFRPAIGGNVSYFDDRFYYGEGALSGTFESILQGMYRSVTVRGAYRSYGDFFPSQEGFYVEARGKLAVPGVIGPGSVAIISPWVLWSDISGVSSVVVPIVTELQPGAYMEWGGRFEIIRSLTSWMVAGLNISASQRDYRTDIVVATGDKRSDTIISPGASLTFPNLFAYQTDLRLDYRYITDRSNDATKRFNDHIVTASVITRFDPTAPPPWAIAGR
ncbi:MAG: hypothetical protein J0I13_01980 [Rhizobiales bacterium]|jgi:hypothetical protein|nr:hypothetical protein [Hyphomicrobiales bacterium]